MKKALNAVLVMALILICGQLALAETEGAKKKDGRKPGAVIAESVTVEATVEAVDAAKRTVTLKRADGTQKTIKAGKEIKNFEQIKAGDKLKATYFESIAVFVRKAEDKPVADELQTVRVAPKGGKPGILVTDTSEITAKVEAIDYKNRTVTLKGPEGRSGTFTVDRRVKRFMAVKVGDELVVRVTDAVLAAVETP
jgi:hypothetical protein